MDALAPPDLEPTPAMRALAPVAPFPRDRFLKWCARLKVMTKDFGLQAFTMLGTQRYIFDEMCKGLAEGATTFVILKSRQIGATTFFIALDVFWEMEYPGTAGAFATHTEQSREQFRNIINVFFNNLPKTHKMMRPVHNRDMLLLANGSFLAYLVAGVKQKTKGSLGRSGAYNFLHATEVAFWGSEEDLKELRATMSALNPHRLQVYETTANGPNHFQEMWEKAVSSPTQRAIFVGWWRNELYAYPKNHPYFPLYAPGEKSPLNALERSRIRSVKKAYDFTITAEQVAWYRWKLDDECDGDQMKMDEMFPWMPEDAFVVTGSTFFKNETLTDATRYAREQAFVPFRYLLTKEWTETECQQVPPKQAGRAELRVWEAADPNGHYAIGCDPAYGSSEDADRTVIAVHRCFADLCYQVAEFCTPNVSTYQCAWVIAHLAGYYRNAMLNLEITGPGQTVQDELDKLRQQVAKIPATEENKNIRNCLGAMRYYFYRRVDRINGSSGMMQWKMSGENKEVLLTKFRDGLDLKRCRVRSVATLEECKKIVREGSMIHGSGRSKDDRVIANALAHEAWRQWVQPRLIAQGLTLEKAQRDAERGGPQKVEEIVMNFLRTQNIKMPVPVKT
jgi:hypothetical protein